MVVPNSPVATLDDLYRIEGKAELIAGRIVRFVAHGELPAMAAGEISVSLHHHVRKSGIGVSYPGSMGFTQRPPLPNGRESFSPDASYYSGPRPRNRMRFIDGAPDFAVEVRSEFDYGPTAETSMAEKRADYFLAGTIVVWDVDPLAETIAVYRKTSPTQAIVHRRGEVADAEPAVPGWRLAVDDIFV